MTDYISWDRRAAIDLTRFLTDLRATFDDRRFTARQVLESGVAPPLAAQGKAHVSKSLGRLFLAREGRWIDNCRIICVGRDSHSHVRLWQVEKRG